MATSEVAALQLEVEQLKQQLAEAELDARFDREYVDTIESGAVARFQLDFTEGVVTQEITITTEDGSFGLADYVGLSIPCSIEDLFNRVAERYIHEENRYWFTLGTSSSIIKDMVDSKGSARVLFDARRKDQAPGPLFARWCMPVVRDPRSGHYIGRGSIADCTNRFRTSRGAAGDDSEKIRSSLGASLRQLYLGVFYVDVMTDVVDVYVSSSAITAKLGLFKPYVTFEDASSALKTFVIGSESETLPIFDRSVMLENLSRIGKVEEEFLLSDGRYVHCVALPVQFNRFGQITGLVVTLRDVSEEHRRKRDLLEATRAAESANEAKTMFLSNLSHDIRTPMNAIVGFSDLLEESLDDRQLSLDYVSKIKKSGSVLMGLVNEVLELSRIDKGAESIDLKAVSLPDVFDTLCEFIQVQLQDRNIAFESSLDIEHPLVTVDEVKLRKILINILSNALKYTEQGTIRVSIAEEKGSLAGFSRYCFEVSDTGMGMSEGFLPQVFDEFSREDATGASGAEGVGLGMSIVKRYVDMFGGEVSVRSAKDKGTTVTVTLPLMIAQEPAEPVQAASRKERDLTGVKVLLAEDDDLNAEIAIGLLSRKGLEVTRVADGFECVMKLAESPAGAFDVVLMDVHMPRMGGYEATEAIRAFDDADKRDIPIIAMTADAFEEDKRRAKAYGMNGHVAKPVDFKVLFDQIGRFV